MTNINIFDEERFDNFLIINYNSFIKHYAMINYELKYEQKSNTVLLDKFHQNEDLALSTVLYCGLVV